MQSAKTGCKDRYFRLFAAAAVVGIAPLLGTSAIAQGASPVLSGGQTPVLEYVFNGNSGATITNTGSAGTNGDLALNVAGTSGYAAGFTTTPGPSGGPADQNFFATIPTTPTQGAANNAAATGGGYIPGTGPQATALALTTDLDGISSFTITGWLQEPTVPPGTGSSTERIFDHTSAGAGYGVLFGKNTGSPQLTMNLNGSPTNLVGTTGTALSQLNTWVFFAVTYSGAGAGTVSMYAGDATTPVAGSGVNFATNTAAGTLLPWAATQQYLALGNYDQMGATPGGPFNRQFNGQLDDIRLYTATDTSAALGVADLNAIRTADLAAPEPSSVVGFALGALCLGGLLLRKRSRATA